MKLESATVWLLLHFSSPCTLALNVFNAHNIDDDEIPDYFATCNIDDIMPCSRIIPDDPLFIELEDVINEEWTDVGGMLPGPMEQYQVKYSLCCYVSLTHY